MELDLSNKEWQDALQLVNFTRRSLFLTGKAGTGKSTFLRYVAAHTKKKHVVLAPTGIAAINAGGSTLHSFFRLPFHPLLPNDSRYDRRHLRDTLKYTAAHRRLLRELELIIIDEVSMVRADIIDFIDKVLRNYTRNDEPFGGKQLLLVGDVYQLEPVVGADDRDLLQPFYPSAYFFNARVWQQMRLVSIELRKVYRQNDPKFIGLLDRIRNGQASSADLSLLNGCVGQQPSAADPDRLHIVLAARRDTVDHINEQRLAALKGKEVVLKGKVKGDFPESSFPTPLELRLKEGAQVLFIRNDKERRWVNGTLGTLTSIDKDNGLLTVHTESGRDVDVETEIWENIKYSFNEKEQKVEENLLGTFVQFPLRLAWAITVHKSQGLTFRQVKIDFAGGAFAGGQTYVALSRCTSLEGITLAAPLRERDIFVKSEVAAFARSYNDQQLIAKAMEESRADSEYHSAIMAFNDGNFREALRHFFIAIHLRYDIEQPLAQRYLASKFEIINRLKRRVAALEKEKQERDKMLKKLSAEYTLLGKECEREHMTDAAIRNYMKALELYPEAGEPRRRMKRLEKKK